MPRTAEYEYALPEHLIARHPAERREASRMLVLHRDSGAIEHRSFADLPSYLRPDDLLVLNNSRVIRARLRAQEFRGELLLVEPVDDTGLRWRTYVRPGRKWRPGADNLAAGQRVRVESVLESGERIVRFESPPDLERHGEIPLPPYLGRAEEPSDRDRYQTVYARHDGSVAAPTAGLHFTPDILARIPHAFVTLHVGPGTFRSVTVDDPRDHTMHEERFELGSDVAERINSATRVMAVGTTSVRVIESCADDSGHVRPRTGRTAIFIHPPYRFRRVGALLTNFHLPRSTLLMLVCAFAGHEPVLHAYREAVREEYRFFSYGDCMLLV
jgi:S-adenosylmethionine:tRNA ribosyltransferase-isomerase